MIYEWVEKVSQQRKNQKFVLCIFYFLHAQIKVENKAFVNYIRASTQQLPNENFPPSSW
jgi:hypothetical protein